MKDFDSVYSDITNTVDLNEIEQARLKQISDAKKTTLIVIGFVVALFVCMIINPILAIILFSLTVFFIIGYIVYAIVKATKLHKAGVTVPRKKSFRSLYKEKLISAFVSSYDSNLTYDEKRSIDTASYNRGCFERFDRFSSNDLIFGDLDGKVYVQMGDVLTEEEHRTRDQNGHTDTYYTTIFQGLFAICNLPTSTNMTLRIRTDQGKLLNFHLDKTQVDMDSQEFEKYFDVYANDKISAMRYLTSDVMDLLITLKKEYGKFEFTIRDDVACIRVPSSDLFEPKLGKTVLVKDILEKDYKYLDYMCKLCSTVYDAVNSKEL